MPAPRWLARMNRRVTNRILSPIWRVVPGFGILYHVGRRSGKTYQTPVNLFRDGGEIVVALTYTSDSDWVKNVLEAGGCEIKTQGKTLVLTRPRLVIDREKAWAPMPVRVALNTFGVHETLRFDVV
jgi:deazaflavin-dependent oxidoreductase (nitroreductase family)